MYESLATCPDDLLLFLHHVPYTHKLHSGKTVIQYIYDSHYEGADAVEAYVRDWKSLKAHRRPALRRSPAATRISGRTGAGLARCRHDWFLRASGIADDKGRVGNYPGRIEAESMKLDGYPSRRQALGNGVRRQGDRVPAPPAAPPVSVTTARRGWHDHSRPVFRSEHWRFTLPALRQHPTHR